MIAVAFVTGMIVGIVGTILVAVGLFLWHG
jgi:preprotein translocase subunit SecF